MDDLCIRPDTDIVIEGPPRSANSTTAHGFLERQQRPVRVAHHKHHAAQLLRAAAWGLPAILLIRPPRPTIVSQLALAEENRLRHAGRMTRGNALTFAHAAQSWFKFYEAVQPKLAAFVIAPFGEVTRDLRGTIIRVNRRFDTSFDFEAPVAGAERELGWHAKPNRLRDAVKSKLEEDFRRALAEDRRLRRRIDRCQALHDEVVEYRERSG